MPSAAPSCRKTLINAIALILCLAFSANAQTATTSYTTTTSFFTFPGQEFTSDPAAVSWSQDRIDVFARGNPDGLWHIAWNRTTGWSKSENLGGSFIGGPGVCTRGPGQLDVFMRGRNNALYHQTYNGAWQEAKIISGEQQITSDPAAVAWSQDRIDVFARGNPDGLWHIAWDRATGWSQPENLGGSLIGAPGVSSNGPNKLDVFVRGTNNALFYKKFSGIWHDWVQLGPANAITSDPSAISYEGDKITVFAKGNPDGLWHMWYQNGRWGGPKNEGGALLSRPVLANSRDIFAHEQNNKGKLSQISWTGSQWTQWTGVPPASANPLEPVFTSTIEIPFKLHPEPTQEEIQNWNRQMEQTIRVVSTRGLGEVFALKDLMYFMIDNYIQANPSLNRDRDAMYRALMNGNVSVVGEAIVLFPELIAHIAERNQATWTADEKKFIGFIQNLAQQQRMLAAAEGERLFLEWQGKEVEKFSGNLLLLTQTRTKPPADFLALAEYGYFVDANDMQNFSKVLTAAGGVVASSGLGLLFKTTTIGAVIGAYMLPTQKAAAILNAMAAGATNAAAKAAAAQASATSLSGAVAGPAIVVTMAITIGVLKAIEVGEYEEYVARLKAAKEAAIKPVTVEQLRSFLRSEQGIVALRYWLAARAATGTLTESPVQLTSQTASSPTGESWIHMSGAARDIGVGANGAVWHIGTDARPGGYGIYRLDGSNWTNIPGAAVALAVGPDGNAWVANDMKQIFRYANGQWQSIEGRARDIAIGANGSVWHIGDDPSPGGFGIYRRDGNAWTKFSGAGVRIAADPQGNPWVIDDQGGIHRHDGNQWHKLPGAAKDIGISTDGKIWVVGTNAVGSGFGVHVWEGQNWSSAPGSLIGIAAGPGKPYGIGPKGEILKMP